MTRHLTSIWFALLPATLLCFAATSTLADFQPPSVSELVAKHAPTNQVVTLEWNPSTDKTVVGYKIYYGTMSGIYTVVVSVGNATNCTLKLPLFSSKLVRFFFAATDYNIQGVQSPFSNEVSYSGNGLVVCFTNWTWPTNTVQASSDLVKWGTAGWQQSLCTTNPTGAAWFRLINTNAVYGSLAQVKGAQLLRQPLVVLPPTLPNIAGNSYAVKLP